MSAKAVLWLCLSIVVICFLGGTTFLWISATCGPVSKSAQDAATFTFVAPAVAALVVAMLRSIVEWM